MKNKILKYLILLPYATRKNICELYLKNLKKAIVNKTSWTIERKNEEITYFKLVYTFKKRKNSYVVIVKQKVNRKYQFFRRDIINGTSQSALNNYIYTKVYTQFSSTSTVA